LFNVSCCICSVVDISFKNWVLKKSTPDGVDDLSLIVIQIKLSAFAV
jgi:hypothetical protein